MQVGEFFVTLGVDSVGGSESLSGFIKQMANMKMGTIGAVGALSSLAGFFAKSVQYSTHAALSLLQFSKQTGQSTMEIQRWKTAASMAGVSAEGVASSVSNLSENLATMRLTGEGIAPYQILGINPSSGDPFNIIRQLQGRVGKVPPALLSALGKQMGVSDDLMYLIKTDPKKLNDLMTQGAARNLTPDEIMKAEGERIKLETMNAQWEGLKIKFATDFFTPMTKVIDGLNTTLGYLNELWAGGMLGVAESAIEAPVAGVAGTVIGAGQLAAKGAKSLGIPGGPEIYTNSGWAKFMTKVGEKLDKAGFGYDGGTKVEVHNHITGEATAASSVKISEVQNRAEKQHAEVNARLGFTQ